MTVNQNEDRQKVWEEGRKKANRITQDAMKNWNENLAKIHYVNLAELDYEAYYEGLKDHSEFRPKAAPSMRKAEKEVGISAGMKLKSLFSRDAREKVAEMKEEAKALQAEEAAKTEAENAEAKKRFDEEKAAQHANIDAMKEKFLARDEDQVRGYIVKLLDEDETELKEDEKYSGNARIQDLDPENGKIGLAYDLPAAEQIPVVTRAVYDPKEEKLTEVELQGKDASARRTAVARGLLLRLAILLYQNDRLNLFKDVTLHGYMYCNDAAFGRLVDKEVIRFHLDRNTFDQIDLAQADVSELFMRVLRPLGEADLYAKSPEQLRKVL
ncbi:MAG: hypothetical protein IKD69_12215 [Solobacterium sp.]|nr:hypothetical protein [Solobacterium sp.]